MAKKPDKGLIVGLDIGTSKVVAIVGEVTPEAHLDIVGIGSHPSRGLKKGVVVNIESTVQSIQRAVEEAELMAGCQIHSVYAGIAGSHIRSYIHMTAFSAAVGSISSVPVYNRLQFSSIFLHAAECDKNTMFKPAVPGRLPGCVGSSGLLKSAL